MEIVKQKRSRLIIIALIFGIVYLFNTIMEFIHIGLEEPLFFLFSSPGDAVFETAYLDHFAKALVSLLITAVFLYSIPQLKKGTLEGFGFIIGAGILAIGIGFLFIAEWIANVIDFAIQGLSDLAVWEDFVFTDGIRIEWFIGIGSISILLIWKNRENYLIS